MAARSWLRRLFARWPVGPVKRQEIILDRETCNAADVNQHGSRLSYNRSTFVVKRGDGEMMLGGLGCLGVGRMWVTDDGTEHGGDPTYADAPYEPRPPEMRGTPW